MNYFHDIIQRFLGIFINPRNLAAKSNILNFLLAVYTLFWKSFMESMAESDDFRVPAIFPEYGNEE